MDLANYFDETILCNEETAHSVFELGLPLPNCQSKEVIIDCRSCPTVQKFLIELIKLFNHDLPSGGYSIRELLHILIKLNSLPEILHIRMINSEAFFQLIDLVEAFEKLFNKPRSFSIYLDLS